MHLFPGNRGKNILTASVPVFASTINYFLFIPGSMSFQSMVLDMLFRLGLHRFCRVAFYLVHETASTLQIQLI